MRLFTQLAAAAMLVAAIPAAAQDHRAGDITISQPWTRATPPSAKVGGGYMNLTNEGSVADRLVGASSPASGRVEIHTMDMSGGVMKMRPLADGLELPAGETVKLAPGGLHLMLIGLKAPVAEGDRVPVTLQFEKAGAVDVELAAGPLGASSAGHEMQHHGSAH